MSYQVQAFLSPHHDGSELYVSNIAPKIGEKVVLKVRIPNTYSFEKGFVRIYEDGEPRSYELTVDRANSCERWYQVEVPIVNTHTLYRFVFVSRDKYDWLNAFGLSNHDVHSNNDFQIVAVRANPEWIKSAVFYQIFPDRFAKSDNEYETPDWAHPREWNELPRGRSEFTSSELYGGDLPGVEERLDHIHGLGVTGIYFTPIFSARSNHRYDASSFTDVDPILGGNKALFSLVKKAKTLNIRIMGDLTSNHCGEGHSWLAKAKKSKSAKERSYFYWDKSVDHGYVGWWGLVSLPKLNFNSTALKNEMYRSKNSIVRKWLTPKYGMSGWRIDVGNMTGRLGADDLHDDVMHGIRQAMDQANPDAWLVAENGDFVASDLNGLGWHGAMNYQGFMRPVWNWLNRNSEIGGGFQGLPFAMPQISGQQLVNSMKQFNASVPWRSVIASMVLLDSHDTARFRTVVKGNVESHVSAMAMVLTYPGVPSIFAGDEIGLEGSWGEDARRTINWDDRSQWDHKFMATVRQLISIRKSNDALINGGLRWIAAEQDFVMYLRESKKQSILVLITRRGVDLKIDLSVYGLKVVKTHFGQEVTGQRFKVKTPTASQFIWEVTH